MAEDASEREGRIAVEGVLAFPLVSEAPRDRPWVEYSAGGMIHGFEVKRGRSEEFRQLEHEPTKILDGVHSG